MLGAFIVAALSATAVPATEPPATEAPKMRCIREEITGSLSHYNRICHTPAQWEALRRDANSEARRITRAGSLNDLNQ